MSNKLNLMDLWSLTWNNLWYWAGLSGDGRRNYRCAFGELQPSPDNLEGYYRYDAMANRVGSTPADASFVPGIRISLSDDPEKEDALTEAVMQLDERLSMTGTGFWASLNAADKSNSYSRYSCIYLNLVDNQMPGMPVGDVMSGLEGLQGLTVFGELNAPINKWCDDPMSARNGRPEFYDVSTGGSEVYDRDGWRRRGRRQGTNQKRKDIKVHHSRMIHVAEGTIDNYVFGIPRLQPVFPYLQMLYKALGSTTESHWLSARNSMFASLSGDFKEADQERFKKNLEEYNNQLTNVMVARGVDFKTAQVSSVSPKDIVEKLIQIIASATRIPQRLLVGNEAGSLASTQDESNWASVIEQRRKEYCEPRLIRPLIRTLMDYGVLPSADTFHIHWPPIGEASAKDKAAVAQTWSAFARNLTECIDKGLPEDYIKEICVKADIEFHKLPEPEPEPEMEMPAPPVEDTPPPANEDADNG